MEVWLPVLGIATLYLLGMGAFNTFFINKGIDYHHKTPISFLYYLTISAIALFIIPSPYLEHFLSVSGGALVALVALAIALLLTPKLIQLFSSYRRLAFCYPRIATIAFRYRFILAKTGEIFFSRFA